MTIVSPVRAGNEAQPMGAVQRAFWAVALLLIALTLVVNAIVTRRNVEALAQGMQASARSREATAAIDDLLATIVDAETGQRGYLLTQRPAYLDPYRNALLRIPGKLAQLRTLLAGADDQPARLADVQSLLDAKLAEMRHTIELLDAGDRSAALAIVESDAGKQTMDALRERIDALRRGESERQRRLDADAGERLATTLRERLAGMLLGLGLVLLTGALLYREMRLRARGAREVAVQREWFRTTLRSIGDAVIVTDPKGAVELLNPVAEQMTGWSAAEAAGKPLAEVFDIVNETTREPARDPVARAIAEGRVVGLANHTILRTRGGGEYAIEDSAAPTYDGAGALQGAVMVFHDVSERRRQEALLRENAEELTRRAEAAFVSERTLHTILENAQVGICLTGPAPDFTIVAVSRTMRDWIGAAENMPAHAAYHKLLPDGSTPDDDLLPLNRVMYHGESVRDERWLIERRGRDPLNVLVNVAPVRDSAGRIAGAVHSWVDLSEREGLDRALRITRARLNVLADAGVIGIMLSFNGAGRVRQANDAFLRMLGFGSGDLPAGAVDLRALTPPEFRDADARAFAEIAASGSCAPYEKELYCRDRERRIPVIVAYARGAGPDEYVGFALDLTERKQLENRLREQAEKLLAADRRKDEFLAMLGHELRNPLSPLRNAVHLLEQSGGNEAGIVSTLAPAMRRQIDHLVRLVDDLLDAARISHRKITLQNTIADLGPILAAAVETVQPLLQARAHTLELSLPQEPLRVDGDVTRLTQLFANILNNAAKYTPSGGRIALGARREGGEAVVSVRDNGEGIAADLLPQIFDPFVQADQSLARSAGGLGIGLALVRRLAELHGGSVHAHSDGPGTGSEFVVRLPLSDTPHPPAQPAAPQPAGASRGARVLVADDNVDLATSTAHLLELWGHEARVVHDGRDALEAVHAFAPDVVLLDIGLPGIDGYEIARRLRAAAATANVRLIAITGYGQERDRARAEAAGFDDHLVKPVEPETLRALLGPRDREPA